MHRHRANTGGPIEQFQVLGERHVKGIEKSPLAYDLVTAAVQAISHGDRYRRDSVPYSLQDIYEVILSHDVNPWEAVLWLGRAYMDYGRDFGVLNIGEVTASNRSTDRTTDEAQEIADRLPKEMDKGMRFVFMIEGELLTDAQAMRANTIKKKLAELAIPAMSLRIASLPPVPLSAGNAESLAAGPPSQRLTIDDSLAYPLILRPAPLGGPGPEQLTLTG